MNVAIAPLVTKKFNVIGRLIIMDDITERMELESQLSQADKLSSIGLLAAGSRSRDSQYAPCRHFVVRTDARKTITRRIRNKGALLEKITRQTFRASEIVKQPAEFFAHQRHRV